MSGISSKRPVERDFYTGNVTLLIYAAIELHDAIYYFPCKSAGFLCPWLIIKYANVYRCLLKFVPIVRAIFVAGWNAPHRFSWFMPCFYARAASDPSSTRSTGAFYAVAIIYCNKTHNPLARPICCFERASRGDSLMNINTCLTNIPLLQFHDVLVDALRNREVTSLHHGLWSINLRRWMCSPIAFVTLKMNALLDIKNGSAR